MNIILDFKNTTTEEQISSYISENSLTIIKTYNHFDKIYLVSGATLPPKTDLLEHVLEDHDHGVSLLENVDLIDIPSEVSDVNYNDENNWWKIALFENVDFEKESQVVTRLGSRITVYLLDSGVNLNHSEFVDNRVQNLFSFNNDFSDTKGHGTALASVITGKQCGISNATVKSVKIFDVNQTTLQSDMLNAFDAVVVDFLTNNQEPAIVNLSWSVPKNTYIESKIDYMISLGMKVICAAGNSGMPIADVTPASMPGVVKVGAYNQNFEACNFSDFEGGSHISVTANEVNHSNAMEMLFGWSPGEKIYTATKDGGFAYASGTSIAAAITSAVYAHNMDINYTTDKNIMFYNTPVFFYYLVFSRKNILNLPEKYSSTPNRISTLKMFQEEPFYDTTLNEIRIVAIYGQYLKYKLSDRIKFTKVKYDYNLSTISDELFIDNGYLYGTINDTWNEGTKQFSFPITLESTTEILNLTVTLTVGHNYKQMMEDNTPTSSVDPALAITLLNDNCCSWNGSSCVQTGPGNCTTACINCCSSDGPFGFGYAVFVTACGGFDKASCCCDCECGTVPTNPFPAETVACPDTCGPCGA